VQTVGATLDFTVTHVPEQTFAYVVRRVAPEQIGEFVRGASGRVELFAQGHGGVLGPAMSVASPPDEDGALALEVGFEVLPGTPAEPPIEVRTLPATVAIVHRHLGAYETLDGIYYARLFSEAHDRGFTPVSAPRERYLGDDEETGEPVTEIVWPIS
jgi:effector-binding domain-containing protein